MFSIHEKFSAAIKANFDAQLAMTTALSPEALAHCVVPGAHRK